MLIFIGGILLALGCMMLLHASFSLDKIKTEWNAYRCHPAYMPFAGYIRPDVSTVENLYYCFGGMANTFYGPVLDILNSQFKDVNSTLGEMAQPLGAFRSIFARIRKFMLSFMATTFSKITNSTSSFLYILTKIKDVLNRFAAQGYIASFLVNVMMDFVISFVFICINIIRIFVYSLLAISIILLLGGQVELVVLASTIAAMLGASGFM